MSIKGAGTGASPSQNARRIPVGVFSATLSVTGWRAAAAQPAVEPEVEPEEPEEEDAAEEEPAAEKPWWEKPYSFGSSRGPEIKRELEAKLSQMRAKYEAKKADREAKYEADKAERQAKRAEELAEELQRAEELAERAERAEPVCVCVCGKCRKGGVSPLASPLGSRSVATFNAKV